MKYETCKFSKLKRVEQPESIRLLPNSPRAGRRFFVTISIPAIDGPAVDGLGFSSAFFLPGFCL